jgi:hypothetical protein
MTVTTKASLPKVTVGQTVTLNETDRWGRHTGRTFTAVVVATKAPTYCKGGMLPGWVQLVTVKTPDGKPRLISTRLIIGDQR